MVEKNKTDEKGNGHTPDQEILSQILKEVGADAEDMRGGGVDSMTSEQKLGVMQRLITAVANDDDYRQVLLTAAFEKTSQAMLAADAISERKRYGVTIQPIVDRMIAQCSINSARVDAVLNGMNRFTLNTNNGGRLPRWKSNKENQSLG